MVISEVRLRSMMEDVLRLHGAPTENARLQADLLLEAELRGHPSHGVMRLRRLSSPSLQLTSDVTDGI